MKSTSEEILHPTEEGRSAWSARLDGGDWKNHQDFGIAQVEDDFEALFSSGTGIPSLGYVLTSPYVWQRASFASTQTILSNRKSEAERILSFSEHPLTNFPSRSAAIYDSQYWMEQYGDAGFHRHVTAAKIRKSSFVLRGAKIEKRTDSRRVLLFPSVGLVLLRMSDSLVIPLNITQYASELSDYRDK